MPKFVKIFFLSMIFGVFLNATSTKSEIINANDISQQNSLSDASTQDITPKSVEDFFDEFAANHGITYGNTDKGRTFLTGKATTIKGANDAEFAKALSLAYNKALLGLQSEFIRDSFGKISIKTLKSDFSDNSSNAKEFDKLPPESAFSQILEKLSNLAGAKLDEMLEKLGVDANKGISKERKKVLAAEKFIKDTTTKALGQISGLVPIQTVVTKNGANYDVGVIAVISNKTIQIANDMKNKRNSLIKGKGKSIKELIPQKNEDFLNEFGIRLVYDENAKPVILSYGRWGYVKNSSDDYINSRQKDIAINSAIAQADGAISEFVLTNLSFSENKKFGEEIEHAITQTINSSETTESEAVLKHIIDKTTSEIKAHSTMSLKGIRTLKRWVATDENGVEHVGVVRFYSYENVKNTDEFINSAKKAEKNSQNSPKNESKDASRTSKMVNNIEDF